MGRLLVIFVLASMGSSLIATRSSSQTGDAWVGTWTLNLAQSSYDPANLAPKNQTTKIIRNFSVWNRNE